MPLSPPRTAPLAATLALVVTAAACGSSDESSEGTGPNVEPEYYGDVDVLRLERRQAVGTCFEPETAENVTIDRSSGDGTISGVVFMAGDSAQDECIPHNYPDEVCVTRATLAATTLTAAEAAELAPLVTAMPHGICEDDPNTHVDPCTTTALYLDGTREASCLGGTQLVEGHGQALRGLIDFIDALAVSKLGG
ncbi:MAG: hypothetical protein JRI23_27590 [Deltaproteobacteria bacterium]|jgi:hypothetical protein|nr:hypothetical protein [Deltaproteobacteria bacterium]MBW2535844.1 hypothetical protein [Deltaproteobacteria bacterium]